MNALGVPSQLRGDWLNAVFLTFGAELPFFENALWREFAPSCRRKIVLADGRQYRDACNAYAHSGLLRFMNLRYAVGGILHPRAAHAKAILLTNEDAGRLLIGSGNLSLQGYASGGELFTRYEYSRDTPDGLPAFQTVRDFLAYLIDHQKVLPSLRTYLQQVLDETPWLYTVSTADSTVRHNLTTPLLEQLIESIGRSAVDELWILSPFLDPGAIALRRLLEALRPAKLRFMVQPELASIDGPAVARTLAAFPGDAKVLEACRTIDGECTSQYLHAKLLVAKLADRAICLHGSANLSQVAMLRTVDDGNMELSNLLAGARNAFDYLLDLLKISEQPVALDDLRLLQPDKDPLEDRADTFELTGGELSGNHLRLFAIGEAPAADAAHIEIEDTAGITHSVHDLAWSSDRTTMAIHLDERHRRLFEAPTPVRMVWPTPAGDSRTNAVYVVNKSTLDHEFGRKDNTQSLTALADLKLDAGLEGLLRELDSVLVLDHDAFADAWRTRGGTRLDEPERVTDVDTTTLSYADIDFERLRNHPRIRQYLPRNEARDDEPSQVQQLLSSMLDRLNWMLEPHERVAGLETELSPDTGADNDEELAEAEERISRRHTNDRRLRDMFKRFIRRYLTGLEDARFRDLAGVPVMTQNYVIFSHLLLELSKRSWFEDDLAYLLDAFQQLWRSFWGTPKEPGYFQTLEPDEQQAVTTILEDNRAFTYLLSTVIRLGHAVLEAASPARIFSLRDTWRHLLVTLPGCITKMALTTTFTLSGEYAADDPSPRQVFADLSALARFQTNDRLARELSERHALQPSSCTIQTELATSPTKTVTLMGEQPESPLDTGQAIVAELLRYRHALNDDQPVYRVVYKSEDGDLQAIFHYELHPASGVHGHFLTFSDNAPSGFTSVPHRIEPPPEPWDTVLNRAASRLTPPSKATT